MSRKRKYLRALAECDTEWIRLSIRYPSVYMASIHIKLHALVLRQRGEL